MTPSGGPAEGRTFPEPEDEAMAEVKPPVGVRLTGSTGLNPLQDGTLRTLVLALPASILLFLHLEFDFLSGNGIAALETAMASLGVLGWSLFDKFIKPRIASS